MFTHEMIKSFNQLEMDVYNYIVSNEEKVVYMKVRELAEEVHVSTTTILRFCKKVGCEGYSEFRLKLKQEVSSKEQKKINMDLTAVKDFLERVQTQAFAENIQEAVKLLTKASSIIFVGVGNSSIIGKYGARYFNNVGWFSFAIEGCGGNNDYYNITAYINGVVLEKDIFNAIFQIQRGRYITKKAFDVDLTKLDKNKYKLGEYNSLFFVAVPESGNKKNLSQRIRVCTFGYK